MTNSNGEKKFQDYLVGQPLDYAEVGLMAGLEVHQQLMTERKMFCHCPAGLYTKDHDGEVLRHMRPTLSELGEYDGTALMEFKTKKNIIYLLHKSNVCTYEMDDTPPFLVNQQALDVAIEQCLMLGCDIVDEVHVARKQYLDGSIPTGFQRTAIVGVNGKINLNGRPINILQVSVEEDSCREVQDTGHLIVWRTDRLGMPLIETVTAPELYTPWEVEEAILLIGRVCRSTGHVRVGLGASRQDVNVSVRGGRRIEIKGVPQAWWAPRLVHGEAWRQYNLLKLRTHLRGRGIKSQEDIRIEHADVTYIFENSALEYLRRDGWEKFIASEKRRTGFELGQGNFCVRAIKLVGLADTLNFPTQPDLTFAHELAGRVRVIAGLDQQPILLHSEKWPDYQGSPSELRKMKKRLGCNPNDAVIIVWGPLQDTLTAAEEIKLRYIDALEGIPAETRQPYLDGHTDFERILPGPDRMYPDTDSPPIRMERNRVEKLSKALPPPPWVREEKYLGAGLPRNVVYYLIRRGGAKFVDQVATEAEAPLRQVGFFFGEKVRGLQRKGVPVEKITGERWCAFFKLLKKQPALAEVWPTLVTLMAGAPHLELEQIVTSEGLKKPALDWQNHIARVVDDKLPDFDDGSEPKRIRFYMGLLMSEFRGRVPARQVLDLLVEKLEKKGAFSGHAWA